MKVSESQKSNFWRINDQYQLNYETSREFLPIVDLIQTEGIPCKNGITGKSSRKRIPMRDFFELKICYREDSRYIELDSLKESEFFLENGIPPELILEDAWNTTWKFSYRNEIPWKYDCPIPKEYIINNIGRIDEVKFLQFILFLLTLFGSLILSCCLPCFEISQGRLYFILCPKKLSIKKEIRLIKADICGSFCQILFNFLSFIPLIVTLLYSMILISFYSNLKIYSCSDRISNETSKSIAEKLESTTSFFNLFIFVLDVILTIKAIVFFVTSCLYLKEKQREKKLLMGAEKEEYTEI
jgi:hypothetical protein